MLKQKVGEYKLEIVMLNNKLNNDNKSNPENSRNVHSYTKQAQTKQNNNIINDKSNLPLRKFDSYNIRSNYNKTFDAVAKAQPIIKKDEQQQPVKFIKFINVNSNNNNDAKRNQNNFNTSNCYNKRMKESTNNEQVSEVEMSFSSKYPNNLFLFDMS